MFMGLTNENDSNLLWSKELNKWIKLGNEPTNGDYSLYCMRVIKKM